MKHLWIINQYAGSPYHGMGFRSYHLAKALLKDNIATTIFSSSFSHVMHTQPDVKRSYESQIIDGIDYTWIKNFPYKNSKSLGRFLSMIYFSLKLLIYPFWLKDKPDAIIISSPSPFPYVNAWLWSKFTGAKLIFEVRDIWPLSIMELGSLSKWNPLILVIRTVEIFAYKTSDHVVSLLPHADKHMIKSGLNPRKFQYIPNGVNLDNSEIIECPISLPKNKFLIGYAGTIGIANNLDLLIETASLVKDPDIHFVIIGKGEFKNNLIEICKKMNLENVSFYDPIDKSQIPHFLSKLDVCYIGLRHEDIFSFGVSPNKLYDYMFAKKPILFCIDSGNHPVSDAKCGYEIPSGKAVDILSAINKFKALSQKEREQMGQNGYDYVVMNHSYEKIAHDYIKILKN